MRRISAWVLLGTLALPVAGWAQMSVPPGGVGQTRQGGPAPEKPVKAPPPPTVRPLAWPRLDRGAVLCKTEDDLARLAEKRQGQDVGNVDCQPIRSATPITVLLRRSPSVTQVKTTDPQAGGIGWTDAWLPEKAPVR